MFKFNSKYWFFLFIAGSLVLTSCKSSRKSSSSKSSKYKTHKVVTNSGPCEKVISSARTYIGTPYKYGGVTRAGMDCSGLVYTSYKSIGKQLPRTSQAQSQFGKKVSSKDLKEGDLVFFTYKKGKKKITHVGMVTQVRGPVDVKFIHASTKLGVVESDLFSDYYSSIFLFAVRVVD